MNTVASENKIAPEAVVTAPVETKSFKVQGGGCAPGVSAVVESRPFEAQGVIADAQTVFEILSLSARNASGFVWECASLKELRFKRPTVDVGDVLVAEIKNATVGRPALAEILYWIEPTVSGQVEGQVAFGFAARPKEAETAGGYVDAATLEKANRIIPFGGRPDRVSIEVTRKQARDIARVLRSPLTHGVHPFDMAGLDAIFERAADDGGR